MLLLPAIDLMGGEVVRLRRGEAVEKTVYSSDPPAIARQWQAAGGDWLHLVDLDAAFSGESRNLDAVRAICASVSIPCELGGGMRSESAIRAALDAGVARVVIGTRASESLDFVRDMCAAFGGERIAVGIDARDGRVAVKGWTETTAQDAAALALAVQTAGAGAIIYTDIATDGMLQGPNFHEMEKLLGLLACPLIASGGVSSPGDVRRLAAMPGLHGAIIGKALYDGHITGDLRPLVAAAPR
ncbi:MAG: 1-(5-phosphoribosyl)-5-[(5-phosphoribosylamino)methylideneamino]imidazole-4-carboxamide isomerase [Terrimicrobiaceae bacterium]|nr:1-(5-phosphoribosyl)-5-[(5-phosphoribosylamino)methylideneamino]imidazole-4-carboxamide isomerase [Terrimicrobiaceae bacterium]